MRLTRYTDYSLRVLIHLALHDERLCSIGEISRTYDLSHNHLMKVVNALAHEGFIETVRGRAGGMRLARSADLITVGEVVRKTEEGFQLADCSGCALAPACGLTGVLAQGMQAMMTVFDSFTIADLLSDRATMRRLTNKEAPLA
ncbi:MULTISPECIES: Rrf2 family transcriptional regulator [Sphingomonadaceae]|uniref:Rrf2 family transcriptional regulator n=1 Tax=Sphingomonadaceae TaxID=41297 RepID=UPI0007016885|nr:MULTISPECIES: Rrf2 family transcriptional regulator [unclassified Sphingomonas]KQX24284.1 Rrf2 family transcriptional regulator [Sphingomonas sp. Root1294]KQY69718.1 Rrf2 family transcriptional regulator [Sphingomonas sp. Root50]KRB93477.1 Rrf2 family transcriptional regulator [Sphingomonas sp. Root720]TXH82442.1 MAG: Rrf2 family transcriptional regulator [Rhizobium sp.]